MQRAQNATHEDAMVPHIVNTESHDPDLYNSGRSETLETHFERIDDFRQGLDAKRDADAA